MSYQGRKSCLISCLFGLLFFLCAFKACGQYKFGTEKQIGLVAMAAGAGLDGVKTGFEFDGRMSFMRKGWTKDPYSFWGNLSHAKPKNKITNSVFDAFHVMDDASKVGYYGGGVVFGAGAYKQNRTDRKNAKWKRVRYWIYDFAIITVTTSAAKTAGLKWIRN